MDWIIVCVTDMSLIYSLKEHRRPPSKATQIRAPCNPSLAAVILTPWTKTPVMAFNHFFSFPSVQLLQNFLTIFYPICIIILLQCQVFFFLSTHLFSNTPLLVLYFVAFCFILFQHFYSISYFLVYFICFFTFYPLALPLLATVQCFSGPKFPIPIGSFQPPLLVYTVITFNVTGFYQVTQLPLLYC